MLLWRFISGVAFLFFLFSPTSQLVAAALVSSCNVAPCSASVCPLIVVLFMCVMVINWLFLKSISLFPALSWLPCCRPWLWARLGVGVICLPGRVMLMLFGMLGGWIVRLVVFGLLVIEVVFV